jgi:hypothetical protein
MPNDIKLGLLLGISAVLLISIVFFRSDPSAVGANPPPTTSVNSEYATPNPPPLNPPATNAYENVFQNK